MTAKEYLELGYEAKKLGGEQDAYEMIFQHIQELPTATQLDCFSIMDAINNRLTEIDNRLREIQELVS